MMIHAENGTLAMGGREMDYVTFGYGTKALVMLPGVGDGLRTVKGLALPFAVRYRAFARRYRVYVLSRANPLQQTDTTRDMANDVKCALDALGISKASMLGVSQGGMIAQNFALDYPEYMEKLVLVATLSRQNRIIRETVESWIAMAQRGDYRKIMADTAEKSYSESYLRTHRWQFRLLGRSGKPKDFCRFIIQAESCLGHDAYDRLSEIQCPTLVLGGSADKIVGANAAQEMAAQISGSQLFIFEGLGHAVYDEAKDFNKRVLAFLMEPHEIRPLSEIDC